MQETIPYKYKQLKTNELNSALELVWKVFSEFEAREYSEQGVKEFKDFIEPNNILPNVQSGEYLFWGCYDGKRIVGVLAMRETSHISLLFVDPAYHRHGIAGRLFRKAKEYCVTQDSEVSSITVNSSPYAVKIYHKLGFQATDAEQTVNGIRFVPMTYKILD